MDERDFVERRQSSWQQLAVILRKATRAGLKSLSRDELRQLGPLYRRAASDLAYARAHATSASLKGFLNALVARSYALLYQTDSRSWSGLAAFFRRDFPQTFRRRLPFFLAAAACLAAGALVGYLLVVHSPDNMDIWAAPGSRERENLDLWASGKVSARVSDPRNAVYASFLMTNNIKVSILAFALGIVFDVLSAAVMFVNGAQLGAYTAWMRHVHMLHTWWPAIVPHGVVELSETCIAGGAGLSLGWAVLSPGAWRRRDALVMAALDSVKLVLGGAGLLIFAGLVEGFISHSQMAAGLKIAFGIASGVAMFAYLFLAGRDPGAGGQGPRTAPRAGQTRRPRRIARDADERGASRAASSP